MPSPSPHARRLLVDLCLEVGFLHAQWFTLLKSMGRMDIAVLLNPGANALEGVSNAVERVAQVGLLDDTLLDQLAADSSFTLHHGALDGVRVELGLLPPPTPVVPPSLLKRVTKASLVARAHVQPTTNLVRAALPLPLAQRLPTYVASEADLVRAMFEAANRQTLEPGDGLWLHQLLSAILKYVASEYRADVTHLLDLVLVAAKGARSEAEGLSDASSAGLQSLVEEFGIMLPGGTFVDELDAALARTCLIRVDGEDRGSGFLVGPDLILTNWHVVRSVLDGLAAPDSVEVVFDYRHRDGAEQPGTGVALAGDWLVDHAPPTDEELGADPDPDITQETSADALDFALLRLAEPAGNGERGFFDLTYEPPYGFARGATLTVLGYPAREFDCAPVTFSIAPDAFLAINPNQTRVRYLTNTLAGNSGSPVLNTAFRVVALHHFGRPNRYNQGIPITALLARPAVQAALSPLS